MKSLKLFLSSNMEILLDEISLTEEKQYALLPGSLHENVHSANAAFSLA